MDKCMHGTGIGSDNLKAQFLSADKNPGGDISRARIGIYCSECGAVWVTLVEGQDITQVEGPRPDWCAEHKTIQAVCGCG